MKTISITAHDLSGTERLDVFLSEHLDMTRSQIQKLIKRKLATISGREVKKTGETVKNGDSIVISIPQREPLSIPDIPIVKETEDYIIIDKPCGVLVHPRQEEMDSGELKETGTIAAWVAARYPQVFGVGEYANRPGIVHRLDREASGLMVVAKTQQSFDSLKEQFKKRTVEKFYFALAHGVIDKEHDKIDFLIARGERGTMAARPRHEKVTLRTVAHIQEGREALTEFWVEKSYHHYTLLRVRLHTGRTHQIRVHFFAYGHPLAGDEIYANKKIQVNEHSPRLFLHSSDLSFDDVRGERQTFHSGLPPNLRDFLTALV